MKYIFLIILSVFTLVNTVFAGDAVLEWDENPDAEYYVVYWSTTYDSFSDDNSVEIPGDLNYVDLKETSDGRSYYLTVKAFNSDGDSSDFSETVKAAYIPVEGSIGEVIDNETVISEIESQDDVVSDTDTGSDTVTDIKGLSGGNSCFIDSLF